MNGPYTIAPDPLRTELERLEREAAPLKAALFAATTHRDIAAAEDYARGWAARDAVWLQLSPLVDALRAVRLEKACAVRREFKRGGW